jgi:PAS domain S-box-containing protein
MAQAKKRISSSKTRTSIKQLKNNTVEMESKLMESIFNAITDGITVIDKDYIITHINRSLVHFYGYDKPEDVIGKKCHVIYSGKDKRCSDCYSKEVFETGKPTHQFIERNDVHGRPLFWEINLFPILDEKGKTARVVYYSRNVTKEKMLEEEAKESERKLTDMLSVSRDVVAEVGSDMKVTFITANVRDFLGYSAEEIQGKKNFLDFLAPESKKIAIENFKARISGKKVPSLYELRFKGKDGRIIPVEVNISLKKKGKEVLGIVATARDISNRKIAEEALKGSEAKYKNLFEKSPVSITLLDKTGRITDCNKSTESLTGFSKSDIVGKRFDKLLTLNRKDLPAIKKRFEKIVKGQKLKPYDLEIVRPDGSKRWVFIESSTVMGRERGTSIQIIARDITDLKNANFEMKLANERLHFLLSSTSAVIYTAKSSGDYPATFISDNVVQMVGYKPDNFIKNKSFWYDHIHPEDQKKIDNAIKQLFKKGYFSYEYRFKKKGGKYIWVRDEMRLVQDEKCKPIEIIGYWTDIHDRKEAEEKLRESEALYRTLVETSPDGITLVDMDTNIVMTNEQGAKNLGYTLKEVMGKSSFDLIAPEDAPRIMETVQDLVEKGKISNVEFNFIHKDGSRVPIEYNAALVLDENGEPMYLMGISRNISERKKAENIIKESEEKYSNLFQSSNDAIFLHDLDGNIIDVNQKVLDLLGYSKKVAKKLNVSKFHPKEELEKSKNAFKVIMEKGQVNFEIDFKKNNGEVFPAEVSSSLFEIGGKNVIQGIVRDITERKKAEAAIRESEELYKSLVEASPDAVTVTDLEGKITFVSERAIELSGAKDSEELIGRNAFEFIALEDRERAAQNLQKTIEDRFSGDLEYTHLRIDGTRYIGELNAAVIKDANGNPKAFIATTRDITEKKEAQDKIKELGEFNKSIIQKMKEGIMILDLEGLITFINPDIEKKLGYKRKELMSESWEKMVAPDYHRRMRDNYTDGKQGLDSKFDAVLIRKDGTELPVLFTGSPQKTDEKLTGVLFVITDMSESKKRRIEREGLMKYKIGRGYTYLVKEKTLEMGKDVVRELFKNGFKGLVITREHPETVKREIDINIPIYWMTNDPKDKSQVKPDFTLLEKIIDDAIDRETFVLLDRFDYLITQNGFMETLNFLQHLNEIFYDRKAILLLSFDPATLNQRELSLLEKETTVLAKRREERLTADLLDLLEYIYNRNRIGEKTSYKDAGNKFKISRTTARKRISELVDKDLIREEKHGRFKYLVITDKGKDHVNFG